jgi:hypothetical protein
MHGGMAMALAEHDKLVRAAGARAAHAGSSTRQGRRTCSHDAGPRHIAPPEAVSTNEQSVSF